MEKSLQLSKEAESSLKTVEKMSGSAKKTVRESVPGLFLIAERGTGVTGYCKKYSEIIDQSGIYSVRGSSTYLELIYPPANADESDRYKFFASPKVAASITNKFYGTFVISFEEWRGEDLIRSESLSELLHFIDSNRGNISFCFHILPSFSARENLKGILSKHVNLLEVELELPDAELSAAYVADAMKNEGYKFDKNVLQELTDSVISDVVNDADFAGYRTLNHLRRQLIMEAAMMKGDGSVFITKEMVQSLKEKYRNSQKTDSSIGFHL